MLTTLALIIVLSFLSMLFMRYILTAPDPAFNWQVNIGYVEPRLLEDPELYYISPNHDTRGLV